MRTRGVWTVLSSWLRTWHRFGYDRVLYWSLVEFVGCSVPLGQFAMTDCSNCP